MSDLLTLAQAAEGATAEEQRDWLTQAFYALNPAPEIMTPARQEWADKSRQFHRMLEAQAWESASLMLVPGGWTGCVFLSGRADLWDDAGLVRAISGTAATPALAIVAAALKARASMERTDER